MKVFRHERDCGLLRLLAQMVEFAGYYLPVQYGEGLMKEHLRTRAADGAGLFDVSHMGQLRWHGKDAADFLETVVVGDIKGLAEVGTIAHASGFAQVWNWSVGASCKWPWCSPSLTQS